MTTTEDLKPCPFCAGPGDYKVDHGWHGVGCQTPRCPGLRFALQHRTEAEAVQAWNRRHDEADAARYRWLRDRQTINSAAADEDDEFRHGSISRIFVGTGLGHAVAHTGAELDAAIDAARLQEGA